MKLKLKKKNLILNDTELLILYSYWKSKFQTRKINIVIYEYINTINK